jgi:hypothetical protein
VVLPEPSPEARALRLPLVLATNMPKGRGISRLLRVRCGLKAQ